MKKKYLVTGGSGFIGHNLVKRLSAEDGVVVSADIVRSPSFLGNVTYEIRDLSFHDWQELLRRYQPDIIYHLAARTDLRGTGLGDYSSNFEPVRDFFRAAKTVGWEGRFVLASSMLVKNRQTNATDRLFEYSPTTLYGTSKVIAEQIALSHLEERFTVVIARPTSIWGPWFEAPYRQFFELVLSGRYLDFTPKDAFKTLGYVGNTIHQLYCLGQTSRDNVHGQVYYLGDYEPVSISTWSAMIGYHVLKKPLHIPQSIVRMAAMFGDIVEKTKIMTSFPMTTFRYENMVNPNVVDLSRTAALIPELPFSIEEGTQKTVEWLTNHSG